MDNSSSTVHFSSIAGSQLFSEAGSSQAYCDLFSNESNEKISSGMLLFSFAIYLLGTTLTDYGWHHHAIGVFFLGLIIVGEALGLLFVSFVRQKARHIGFPSCESSNSSNALINDLIFISIKM